jgi:hypothetical protein
MYGSYPTQPPSQQQQQYGYQQQQQPQYGYPPSAAASLLSQQQQQSSYGGGVGGMMTTTPQFPAPAAAIVDEPQQVQVQPPAPIYIDTQHDDMIHDAQLDYYGTKLATGSSGTYSTANCVCVSLCVFSVYIVVVVIICLYSWCQEIYHCGGGRREI